MPGEDEGRPKRGATMVTAVWHPKKRGPWEVRRMVWEVVFGKPCSGFRWVRAIVLHNLGP